MNIKKISSISVILLVLVGVYVCTSYISAQTPSTNYGPVVDVKNKNVVEYPFGGSMTVPGAVANSVCPDDSVLVGFNLYNTGGSYSGQASLYCQSMAVNLGAITIARRSVIESPRGAAGNSAQIDASSCPDGSVVVGFNLLNVGDNYSIAGDLYCRQIVSAKSSVSAISNVGSGNITLNEVQDTGSPTSGEVVDPASDTVNYSTWSDTERPIWNIGARPN
jgi:hypothetical protein